MNEREPQSLADLLRALPSEERQERIRQLSKQEAAALEYDGDFWLRPNQQLPTVPCRQIVALAGRGWGKNFMGVQAVRKWTRNYDYVNLIGATASDARDVMIEGESGILALCPPNERPVYVASKSQLQWPNGAKSLIFSAEEGDRLRGKQHSKLWMDELCAWRWAEDCYDQGMFGLRLGDNPQCLITSTPKPTRLLKRILAEPTTITIRGTSYENAANLAPGFLAQIVNKYHGTRLGRQELLAELLSDNPGALWTYAQFDESRVTAAPQLNRVVVAVDPAVTAREDSDLTGIIVAGRGTDNHFYILDDVSLKGSPDTWAAKVVHAYRKYRADRIVAEVNQGGDLVESILRTKDLLAAYKAVHATRGKLLRAEPISGLYEQKRVHHVGSFPELESECCDYNPQSNGKSPDRMDALVWGLTALSDGTRQYGFLEVAKGIMNGTLNPEAATHKTYAITDDGVIVKLDPPPPPPPPPADAPRCPRCGGSDLRTLPAFRQYPKKLECLPCRVIWHAEPTARLKETSNAEAVTQ
jgi:phage terminase large subunit-like protein